MPVTTTYLNHRWEVLDAAYDVSRAAQYRHLARLFNRTLGPVVSIVLHTPDLSDLSLFSTSCTHVRIDALMRDIAVKAAVGDTVLIPGGGKGVSPQPALLGGLGEVAERLLALLHFGAVHESLVHASYEDLVRQGRRALGPSELALFAPEQYQQPTFPYVPFAPDARIKWIEGVDLLSGAPVLAPAQIVLIYYKHHVGEARIGYPTTGGLAFHTDRRLAILHGLYEFIERDAINVRWFCKLPPKRVDVDLEAFARDSLGLRVPRLSTKSFPEVKVFLNTLDVDIPVFTTTAIDLSRSERAFLGGGGAWSGPDRALAQSLLELGQSRTALKFYQPIGLKNIRADSDLSEMTDFFDAAVYYGYRENWPHLSWYLESGDRIRWSEILTGPAVAAADEYKAVVRWLASTPLRPVVFDLGGACWPGVTVTKVLIPELTHASIPSHPYLGHPRYYSLPRQLGLRERTLEFRDLSTGPVPFP